MVLKLHICYYLHGFNPYGGYAGMVLPIKMIKNTGLLVLCLVFSSCRAPHSTEQAVADYSKALGLVPTTLDVDGEQVQAWQFLLCDRVALLHADTAGIEKLLADPEVCYNPLVDAEGGAAVFFTQPDTSAAQLKAKGRWLVKGLMLVGGGTLAFFSVKFGFRTWKWFSNAEEYIRHSQILKRSQQGSKFFFSNRTVNRVVAWLAGGGLVGFFAWFFLVGDGAFTVLGQLFNINKTYFNQGKKVLFEWGLPEQSFINDYDYLVNDAWQDTKKTPSIDTLLLGIKNTLKCDFSPRYLEENPLRAE